MRRVNQVLAWGLFLLVVGIFLLLKNLGIFKQWGEAIWGGLFAAVGLGFIIWFVIDRERWWRAIAGFTLLGIGAVILLGWQNVDLGDWRGALVLLGVALGFWAVLLAHSDNWWAVIPAGVLTVVGLLVGLAANLSQAGLLAALLIGLGLVFALLYLARFGQHDTHWAGIPAAALLLVGLVTLVAALGVASPIQRWWPVLLVVAGLALLLISLLSRRPPGALEPAPVSEPQYSNVRPADYGTIQPAPAASNPEMLPEKPAEPLTKIDEKPGDIYDILAQQPPERPAADAPNSG